MSAKPHLCPEGGTLAFHRLKDGRQVRYGHWPARTGVGPGLLILPGRTEFIEKYFEIIDGLLTRGYAVMCLDWPNQGMSDRPLPNRNKHYVADFGDLAAVLNEMVETIAVPAMGDSLTLLAHSMGGHCALRYLHDCARAKHRIDAAVLNAPMIDINYGGLPRWLVATLLTVTRWFGMGQSYALGQQDHASADAQRKFEALLSSDENRIAQERALIKENPKLHLGGVTWGFLDAAWASSRLMEEPGFAESIKTPVLIFRCGRDKVIDNDAIDRFVPRLPNGRVVAVDDARHELLRERDALLDCFWSNFDAFMAQDRSIRAKASA